MLHIQITACVNNRTSGYVIE